MNYSSISQNMKITLHLPSTLEVHCFFIETERFVFKVTSFKTKVEVTDEGLRPTGLTTIEISSIEDFRKFIETHNINANDVIFCISFLAQLKNRYP